MNTIEKNNVKDVYENIAHHFSNTRTYKWTWVNDFLDTIKCGGLIYDIGCGNGRNMNHNNLNFIGIDNCENFTKICREKNLNIINANITTIPLKSETCDGILCIIGESRKSSPPPPPFLQIWQSTKNEKVHPYPLRIVL